MNTQKVSIIIPVYNGAQHIAGIFDFLADQSYDNFEAIFVVDQKTTDDTLERIESEKHRVSDVKVIIQTDQGKLGGARNLGLNGSDGSVIWFLDVDDKPVLDILDYTVAAMESNDADVVMFNSIRSYEPDIDIPSEREYKVDVLSRSEAIIALSDLKLPITAWSKIIRRNILTDNNIEFTHGYAEDIQHTYLTVDKAKRICYCERPMYIYLQNPESICNNDKHSNTRGQAEIAAYGHLEEYFSNDQEINEHFRKRSALIRIRSAVHMDKDSFVKYAKSQECRRMLEEDLRGSLSPEVLLFRMSPSLYYSLASYYMRTFYYKDKRYFSKPKKV